MSKMKNCKTCGASIAENAKSCPSCGAKNRRPLYTKVWFWLLMIAVISAGIGAANSSTEGEMPADATQSEDASAKNHTVSAVSSVFEGDCGFRASAEMRSSVIGYPELVISIENTSSKKISAIQFYAVPLDVYGEEITGWTSQNNLYTDDAISAGTSTSIVYSFIEDSVKTVKLYVYSVYFDDGTEWGNREATKTQILSNGRLIEVSGNS